MCALQGSQSQNGSKSFSLGINSLSLQCSYYPMFPPAVGTMLDTTLSDSLILPQQPDVLMLPSDLNCFAKPTLPLAAGGESAVCVNPGRAAKGSRLGSYARVEICQPLEGKVKVQDRCRVEIRQL